MSRFAKVTSIDVVERLTSALQSFKEEASNAVDSLELEIQRAVRWIQNDQKNYWKQQIRRSWDQVGEARTNLERAMTYRATTDYRPACREEKLELEKAKRRLRRAEEKAELVRHWSREVDHELTEYRGSINQLSGWLQSDHPRAIAALKRMTSALESYVALRSSGEAAGSGPSSPRQEGDSLSEQTSTPQQESLTEEASQASTAKDIDETSSGSTDDENMGSTHGRLESGGGDGVAPDDEDRNDDAVG